MKKKALSNLSAIDLTHYIAGPYCTKLMAGFGAEVIKIERPKTGDKMRGIGPFFKNQEGLETSIPFLWLNTGKKGITLNLKTEKGREIFKRLVQDADLLVENFSPRVMPGLDLNYEILKEINPRLVMASISNFGQTGVYRDYKAGEMEIQAMSGQMYLTGDPDKQPLAAGPAVSQYSAGMHAYTAILMALFQRELTGEGQYIDVSIMECGIENIEIKLSYNLQMDKNAKRGGHLFVPWDMYECKDGYATITAMPHRHWHRAAEIFTDPRLFDQKYEHLADRVKHRGEYEEILKSCVKEHGKRELFHAGQTRKLAFGYLAGIDEAIESPQHRDREFFAEIDHPVAGEHKYCGAPFKMSKTPYENLRSPLLGEHNQMVYRDRLSFTQQEIQQLKEEGVT